MHNHNCIEEWNFFSQIAKFAEKKNLLAILNNKMITNQKS